MITEHNTSTEDTAVEATRAARLVMTGSCEGLAELRDAIAAHPELELRGLVRGGRRGSRPARPRPRRRPARDLRRRSAPEDALAAIREHTDAPVVLVTPAGNAELRDADGAATSCSSPTRSTAIAAVVEGLRGGSRTDAADRDRATASSPCSRPRAAPASP